MLHIVKSLTALRDFARYAVKEDEVLLVESAVYAANSAHKDFKLVSSLLASTYVLSADVEARGLALMISESIQSVDFAGWVTLTERHSQSMTWD